MAGPGAPKRRRRYGDGSYWRARTDLLYYQYYRAFVRHLGAGARSLVDVGSGNAPYLEWFDWIPERVSVDRATPYASETVRGVRGDIFALDLGRRFDLCTCMQVLEHVPEPERFARRLLAGAGLGALPVAGGPGDHPRQRPREHRGRGAGSAARRTTG